jgi:hydrogenase maturation protease
MSVLVGGLGYRNLRDHSAGVAVTDTLMDRRWPEGVTVEDVSYNPVALVEHLKEERYDRAVIVAAVERPGRSPGEVTAYRWDGALPSGERIQAAVVDAVTGVIFLDNTLIVTRHFGGLPNETAVVEIEPEAHEFGESFSAPVAKAFETVCDLVTTLAVDPQALLALPRAPLGGVARERA